MSPTSILLYVLTGFFPTALAYWLIGLIVVAIIRRIRGRSLKGISLVAWRYSWPLAALWTFYDLYSHFLAH